MQCKAKSITHNALYYIVCHISFTNRKHLKRLIKLQSSRQLGIHIFVQDSTLKKYYRKLEFDEEISSESANTSFSETIFKRHAILDKTCKDFYTFWHSFPSPQVKRNSIIITRQRMYTLP